MRRGGVAAKGEGGSCDGKAKKGKKGKVFSLPKEEEKKGRGSARTLPWKKKKGIREKGRRKTILP